jgi:type VI protein secretion system component VasF
MAVRHSPDQHCDDATDKETTMSKQKAPNQMPSNNDAADENYLDTVVVPASALVEVFVTMKDLRPEEKITILWDGLARALQAFPAEEHAGRLARAIECACFCAHIDPIVVRTAVPSTPWDVDSVKSESIGDRGHDPSDTLH